MIGLTEKQQEIRKNGIGSSEIAGVANICPYSGPHSVYCRKKGIEDEIPRHHSERGYFFEPALIAWYEHRTGREVHRPGTLVHPKHGIVIATPDGLTGDGIAIECKMPTFRNARYWGEPGTDEIPKWYIPQCQWHMGVTGAEQCDVLMFADGDLRVYTVNYNDGLFRRLVEIAEKFWAEHIEADVAPEPDASDRTAKMLQKMYPRAERETKYVGERIDDLSWEYTNALESEKEGKRRKALASNKLKSLIGDYDTAEGDLWIASWSGEKRRTLRVKEKTNNE